MPAKRPTHEVHRVQNRENDWAAHGLAIGEVVSEGSESECLSEAEELRAKERTTRPADSPGHRYVVHPYGTAARS